MSKTAQQIYMKNIKYFGLKINKNHLGVNLSQVGMSNYGINKS